MLKKAAFSLALVCLIFIPINAQEDLGMINDNYLPSIGMRLNPSAIVDQKPWMSIHLAGASAYLRNNLAYFPNSTLLKINGENEVSYDNNRNKYSFFSDVEIQGPAISFTYRKHALGIRTSVRSFASAYNIPGELGELLADDEFEIESGNYEIRNLNAKGLAWGEIGVNYGQIFKQSNGQIWSWGVGVNRLHGLGSAGLEIGNASLEIRDTLDYGIVGEANANYFYAEPQYIAGKGWSLNAGLTIKQMKSDVDNHVPHSPKGSCNIPDYRYKLAIAIIDFGSIRFSTNAEAANLTSNFDTDQLEDLFETDPEDQIVLEEESEFRTATPLALSLQYDYNLNDRFYLNATLVQNLAFMRTNAIRRSDILGASVRYESRWLGAAIPVSLQNYRNIQVGAALRLGIVVLGSDHILPFFVPQDINSANAYFALHIPIIQNPSCVEKGQKKSKKKSRGKDKGYPPCPKW